MSVPLPRREQQVLEALFTLGEASAEQIRERLSDPPSNSAVRAMLARIETKGWIRHRIENQRYLYQPVTSKRQAGHAALRRLIASFFGGSPASAATALLGMSPELDEQEIRELERLLREARKRAGR